MNDGAVSFFTIWFMYTLFISILFFVFSTMDGIVTKSCKEQGYWQTGQTRVICSVEEPKKGK